MNKRPVVTLTTTWNQTSIPIPQRLRVHVLDTDLLGYACSPMVIIDSFEAYLKTTGLCKFMGNVKVKDQGHTKVYNILKRPPSTITQD